MQLELPLEVCFNSYNDIQSVPVVRTLPVQTGLTEMCFDVSFTLPPDALTAAQMNDAQEEVVSSGYSDDAVHFSVDHSLHGRSRKGDRPRH